MTPKRIAIMISGQPRSYEKGYEYLKKNLLDPYDNIDWDVKIFFHIWAPLYDPLITDSVVDLYKPGDYYDNVQFHSDPINKKYTNIVHPQWTASNTYHMWYSVFLANQVKKQYELSRGMIFDVVVRTRFDYALNHIIDFSQVEPGKLYVPNCRNDPAHMFCSDIFAYGTSEVMDWYSNVYTNIDFLYSRGIKMNGEEMLAANLAAYGLIGDNMVYFDPHNPFPPGKYNGNSHSLIRDDFTEWNKDR